MVNSLTLRPTISMEYRLSFTSRTHLILCLPPSSVSLEEKRQVIQRQLTRFGICSSEYRYAIVRGIFLSLDIAISLPLVTMSRCTEQAEFTLPLAIGHGYSDQL